MKKRRNRQESKNKAKEGGGRPEQRESTEELRVCPQQS
jgi:hypothetical protein